VKLVWLRRALNDRNRQADRIAKDSPRAAVEQLDRVEAQANALCDHPERGRSGRRRGTRELVVSQTPFIVVYRLRQKPEQIEVLRVLHGAQKWP
jgi:toxin ParE1/3/4